MSEINFIPPLGKMLVNRHDQTQAMEEDLKTKAQVAFNEANVQGLVHGVFSLDDLEAKSKSELVNQVAVGIGYLGAEPMTEPKASPTPGKADAAKMLAFRFILILAVPSGPYCDERFNGTKLLTVLRSYIFGSTVAEDSTARTWGFEKESPNIEASTEEMLYYSQVWYVAIPLKSKSR